MQSTRNIIIAVVAAVAVIGMTAAVAYRLGKRSEAREARELRSQLEEQIGTLVNEQRDAEITRCVSEQMSDIAKEEKKNSDIQRQEAEKQAQEAEKQAHLANENEMEAKKQTEFAKRNEMLARSAEARATKEAQEADKQRKEADRQRNSAEHQMLKRLGQSLGTAALNQSGNDELLSKQLSYWSWKFLQETGGNKYCPDTYNSLVNNSDSRHSVRPVHSSINAITAVPGHDGCYAAVTSYGEIILIKGANKPVTTFLMKHDASKGLDFRAVLATKDLIYALSADGRIIVLTLTGREKTPKIAKEQNGGTTVNSAMLFSDDGNLVVGAQDKLYIVDKTTLQRTKSLQLPGKVQCMYHKGKDICCHMQNGTYAVLDGNGTLHNETAPQKKNTIVTCGAYDSKHGLTILGRNDGVMETYNRYGRHIVDVLGHTSRISAICFADSLAIIASYDHIVLVCNMNLLKMESGYNFVMEANSAADLKGHGPENEEWLTPAGIRFDGWPLCLLTCGDRKSFVVGTSKGMIECIGVSVDRMAGQVRTNLHGKNMTKVQWDRFIGKGVPMRDL